jgi:hypothetical protein
LPVNALFRIARLDEEQIESGHREWEDVLKGDARTEAPFVYRKARRTFSLLDTGESDEAILQ